MTNREQLRERKAEGVEGVTLKSFKEYFAEFEKFKTEVENLTGKKFDSLKDLVTFLEQIRPEIAEEMPSADDMKALMDTLNSMIGEDQDGIGESIKTATSALSRQIKKQRMGEAKELTINSRSPHRVASRLVMQDERLSTTKELTPYHWYVYDVIITMYEEGAREIYLEDLYKALQVKERDAHYAADESRYSKLEDYMRDLMGTILTLNVMQEIQAHGYRDISGRPLDPKKDGLIESNLLYSEKKPKLRNGNLSYCYEILRQPVLAKYMNMNKQMTSYRRTIGPCAFPSRYTEERQLITHEIMQALRHIQSETYSYNKAKATAKTKGKPFKGRKPRTVIRLDGVMDGAGITLGANPSRKRKAVCDDAEAVLDAAIEHQEIKGYKKTGRGQEVKYTITI